MREIFICARLATLIAAIGLAGCGNTTQFGDAAPISVGSPAGETAGNTGSAGRPSAGLGTGIAGARGGAGGRLGSGGAGVTGGAGFASTAGRGGGTGGTLADAGTVSKAMCIATSDPAHAAPAGCVDCLCTKNAVRTAACGANCWSLLNCTIAKCSTTDTACLTAMCASELSANQALSQAMAAPLGMCTSQCTLPFASDAGTDAGN